MKHSLLSYLILSACIIHATEKRIRVNSAPSSAHPSVEKGLVWIVAQKILECLDREDIQKGVKQLPQELFQYLHSCLNTSIDSFCNTHTHWYVIRNNVRALRAAKNIFGTIDLSSSNVVRQTPYFLALMFDYKDLQKELKTEDGKINVRKKLEAMGITTEEFISNALFHRMLKAGDLKAIKKDGLFTIENTGQMWSCIALEAFMYQQKELGLQALASFSTLPETTYENNFLLFVNDYCEIVSVLMNKGMSALDILKQALYVSHAESAFHIPCIITKVLEYIPTLKHIAVDKSQNNFLHVAIKNQIAPWLLEKLLKKKVDVNARNNEGKTPIFLLRDKNNNTHYVKDCMQLLCAYHADLSCADNKGQTVLHVTDSLEVMQRVLQADKTGILVQLKDNEGRTPLLTVCGRQHKRKKMMQALLSAGGDVNISDKKGKHLLHEAYCLRDNIFNMLLNYKVNVNIQDGKGRTPLYYEIKLHRYATIDVIKRLLKAGADPNIPDHEGKIATSMLIEKSMRYYESETYMTNLLSLLAKYGADLTIKSGFMRDTLLHKATYHNCIECVKILLVHKVNVNEKNMENRTPLHYAIKKDLWDIEQLLQDEGADYSIIDKKGKMPDHYRKKLSCTIPIFSCIIC